MDCVNDDYVMSRLGDGICDDATGVSGVDLSCDEYALDGGDCTPDTHGDDCITFEGTEGFYSCDMECLDTAWYSSWIGDGICDDVTDEEGVDLYCTAFELDGGDCAPDAPGDYCSTDGCTNTCGWASDGVCDDGGTGSTWDDCDLGTDCDDCGPRESPGFYDCDMDCVSSEYASWQGDGICDNGEHEWGINLFCEEFLDDGDGVGCTFPMCETDCKTCDWDEYGWMSCHEEAAVSRCHTRDDTDWDSAAPEPVVGFTDCYGVCEPLWMFPYTSLWASDC
jgi:hypothetical protein